MKGKMEYGGIIETMYSQFPLEEIPEEIREYKKRMDSLFASSSKEELSEKVKSFEEKEIEYLNSPMLDDFFKISKGEHPLREAIKINANEKILELYLRLFEKFSPAIAIVLAGEYGNLFIVKKLYEKVKKFRIKNTFISAATNNHISVINFLLDEKCVKLNTINDALSRASKKGHIQLVNILINAGADIHHSYAIILASQHGHLDVVKLLLEKGADVHAEDDKALRLASQKGNLDIVNFLLENGANVHAENNRALMFAAENGHFHVVKRLIEAGANIRTYSNWALEFAARGGYLDVVNLLIENGANIYFAKTCALKYAAKQGHIAVVNRFLELGANANIALKEAVKKRNLELVKVLIGHGANLRDLLETSDEIISYLFENYKAK